VVNADGIKIIVQLGIADIGRYILSNRYYSPFFRATKEDNRLTNNTILMLLAGIRIAATMGDNNPCTAKDKPTTLYKIDKIKLAKTMRLPALA
jgi:hypothetical protein